MTDNRTPRIRRWMCEKLGWHKPKSGTEHYHPNDPLTFLLFAECKYCGRRITRDSQGNWYEMRNS